MSDDVIRLSEVTIFQQDHLVLHEVNLALASGELSYLIGKTGSGKSSLLKCLYGDLSVKSGQASVAGFDLVSLPKKKIPFLRRQLGIVFQDFNLLNDRTVSDNLSFVLKATGWSNQQEINQRIDEVLQDVGLTAKGYKMPYALSGGEQQRLVIARALLNQPQLLLADEPTGNLDPYTSEEIMKLLVRLNKEHKMAMLIATHDYPLIEQFPARIVLCKDERTKEVDSVFF